MLLQRHKRKLFLHQILTGDEKWIYSKNRKRTKSWIDRGKISKQTARPELFGKKTMLCVWWDQKGVEHYDLLKPGKTVNLDRY